jgi:hypothetical protein
VIHKHKMNTEMGEEEGFSLFHFHFSDLYNGENDLLFIDKED